jgi:hypothetical protein
MRGQDDSLVSLEIVDGRRFVLAHQPRISGDVRRENRGEAACRDDFSHCLSWKAGNPDLGLSSDGVHGAILLLFARPDVPESARACVR